MSDNKPRFVLCPRCELNYIEEGEEYCKVCKASMGLIDASILIPDDDEMSGEKICPICKVNYIGEDEDMCIECRKEREAKEQPEESEDDWQEYVEDEVPADDDEISLSELAEEEEMDEEEEEDDDSYGYSNDFDYDDMPDDSDFEDEEDEEEEEEGDDY